MGLDCRLLVTTVVVLLAYVSIKSTPVAGAYSDFSPCNTWNSTGFYTIKCPTGPKNLCCNKELIKVDNKTSRWSQVCCSEKEYIEQNLLLFLLLIAFNIGMAGLVILIIVTSFSVIILTEKAALE